VHTIVLLYPSLIFSSSSVHNETDDQQQPWRATNWMGSMLKPCMHTQTVWPEGQRERERRSMTWWIELVSMSQNLGNLSWPLESKICCSIWVHLSETHFNNPAKSLTLLLILTWVDLRYTPLKYVCCGLWISCSNSPNKLVEKEGVYNTVAGWLPTSTPSLTSASSSASARGGSQGSAQMLIIQSLDRTNLTYY
jgi:hypothetical protein